MTINLLKTDFKKQQLIYVNVDERFPRQPKLYAEICGITKRNDKAKVKDVILVDVFLYDFAISNYRKSRVYAKIKDISYNVIKVDIIDYFKEMEKKND